MMVRLGRKPRTDRWRSGFFFKLKNRPRIAATICPTTVATASAGHAHPGCAAQSKDQNGVHDDVDDGAQQLGAHGQTGTAGGLQQPLKAELAENTHGKT